jgi:hypothetical protein
MVGAYSNRCQACEAPSRCALAARPPRFTIKLGEAKPAGLKEYGRMVLPPSFKFIATLIAAVLAFAMALLAPVEPDAGLRPAATRSAQGR